MSVSLLNTYHITSEDSNTLPTVVDRPYNTTCLD